MGMKLSQPDLDLYRAVDEVLYYIWDPIGVSGVPQTRDEYHGYLPQVFQLLKKGSDEKAIAEYLGKIVTESMGLSENTQHDLKIAEILLNWKEALSEKYVE
jgi:hypothetical protein